MSYVRVPCTAPKMATLSSGYQPGVTQPYSKWSTDRDEVQVDYDQLNAQKRNRTCFSGRKGVVLKILIVVVVFFLGLIFGYVVRRSVHEEYTAPFKCAYTQGYERYSADISRELRTYISASSLEQRLRSYTGSVHLSGCHENTLLAAQLRQHFHDMGLEVSDAHYEVLMSFPNWETPNTITLVNSTGGEMFTALYEGKHFHPELQPYNAFAANGTVQADLVYANYGEESDFLMLAHNNISSDGRIVMMRYGRLIRKNMVANAAAHGAVGVILFSDPEDVTDLPHTETIYPNGPELPGWGVQRGTVLPQLVGDPLTPGLPSIDGIYRLSESEAELPTIPVQPIGYDHANILLRYLDGSIVDSEFVGGINNLSYKSGPGFTEPQEDWKVKLENYNERLLKKITNIFAYINGEDEPDRYVIVGCHYDAWTYGAWDPNSGTAVLMEVAKALTDMVDRGWKPRRTIIFAHWDGEEQAVAGSYEWVQEHHHELAERTVLYINLDAAVNGNYTFSPYGSPMLYGLLKEITKGIQSPHPDPNQSEQSVYDNWVNRNHYNGDSTRPKYPLPGDGSDYAPFAFGLGVTSVQLSYRGAKQYAPYYHTAVDNFNTTQQFLDPGFKGHETLTQITAELVLQMATHTRLPLDPREIAHTLAEGYDEIHPLVTRQGASETAAKEFEYLSRAIGNFTTVAEDFHEYYNGVPIENVLKLRHLSDRLLHLPKVFINTEGLPDREQFKNILYGPTRDVGYTATTFPAIRDWFAKGSESEVLRQLSIATVAVQSASHILRTNMFETDHIIPTTAPAT